MYSKHTIVQIMNTCTTAPETLQYSVNTPERLSGKPNQFTNKNMLERQQQQTPLSYNAFSAAQKFQGSTNPDEDLDGLIAQAMKLEPGLETSCDDFGSIIGGDFWGYGNILSGLDTNASISRTLSCPQAVSAANKGKETVKPEKQSSSFKKRKADKTFNLKDATEDDNNDKKLKGCTEVRDSMSKETSDISKEKSKTSDVQKTDYIHVRARRGQATDSHSLAERVRREKISERMKYLQDLVPGCNSITGKAGMLDEIINYVQSLQRQVEFLSMKLAAVNPGPDFSDDNYYTKEVFPVSNSEFHHLIEELPEICLPPNYQSDVLHQAGLGIGFVPPMALRRTISAPVSIPFESPCFSYLQSCSTWDAEPQGIFGLEFQQARSSLPYQLRTGFSAGGHVRM